MFPNDTDKAWKKYGETDPYFGVVTWEGYRTKNLTPEAKRRFFDSGNSYIDLITSIVRKHLGGSFKPMNALDFGCGVGRLVIPLSRQCESVTGVDISEAMILEAIKNCKEQGVLNAKFVKGDDALSQIASSFDFINSYIVFQHIPCKRGEAILRRLIGLLQNDGVAILHFTYFKNNTQLDKFVVGMYTHIPLIFALRNLAGGKPIGEPLMQVNEYNLNHVFRILQDSGCYLFHILFTDQHGVSGVILFIQKKTPESGTASLDTP